MLLGRKGHLMFTQDGKFLIAVGDEPVYLLPRMANRHGLIAGATGTGKTITLKVIAESMSDAGIPVFLADIKGDASGIAIAGEASDKVNERLAKLGVTGYQFHGCPVRFWDVYGEGGHPVRTTISEMGPTLLGRLLNLTDAQEGVLNIVFRVADDQQLLLLDLKDLRSMVTYCGENSKDLTNTYGNVSSQSVGVLQRSLLALEDAGGDIFFGEPALDINDWLACDSDGKGMVNILHCVKLFQSPLLYSTFLLWMLTELYERLPEVGDMNKPKIVFFFDEAHLLFSDSPKALVDKVEQVVKLIRSKGVGVYFITQNPADIPGSVLAQLGNRVQHALRAYTPAEQKTVKAAADSFRVNPAFKTEDAITDLGTGEALISFLDADGKPSIVQRGKVLPPMCNMGAAPDDVRSNIIAGSPLKSKYESTVDRESANELLTAKAQAAQQAADEAKAAEEQAKAEAAAQKQAEKEAKAAAVAEKKAASHKSTRQTPLEKAAGAAMTSIGRSAGTALMRGLLGMLKK